MTLALFPGLGLPADGPSDHWNTPPDLCRVIEAWMGQVDLDPCSNDTSHVRSVGTCKLPADGLAIRWPGRIFINPPYSSPGPWLEKAVAETRENGLADVVVALVKFDPSTAWWNRWVWPYADVIALRKRVRFSGPGDVGNCAPFPCALLRYTPGDLCDPQDLPSGIGWDLWARPTGGAA